MGRGLGKRQAAILQALHSLEAEYSHTGVFRFSVILARVYDLSEEMREAIRAEEEEMREQLRQLEEGPQTGNPMQRELHMLTLLVRSRQKDGRTTERRRNPFEGVNLTRATGSLVRRGLVNGERGSFGLTIAGRLLRCL